MPPQLDLLAANALRAAQLPAPFACSWSFGRGGAERVAVTGELDIATTPLLADALRASQLRAHEVELDLRDTAFMDTSAVHVIVAAAGRAREVKERLVLLSGRAHVDRILELTGVPDDVEVRGLTGAKRRP